MAQIWARKLGMVLATRGNEPWAVNCCVQALIDSASGVGALSNRSLNSLIISFAQDPRLAVAHSVLSSALCDPGTRPCSPQISSGENSGACGENLPCGAQNATL